MKSVVIISLCLVGLAGATLAGCSPAGGSASNDHTLPEGSSASDDCTPAGGQCVIGNAICAVQGPQSCGPPTPAGAFCCLTAIADCGQPAAFTYTCTAVADGGPGCKASTLAFDLPSSQVQDAGDQDASFPVGCTATLPVCNNGHVPYCTCASGPSTHWNCYQ